MPGGVNSPVRAFKSVGRDPLFHQPTPKGSKIYDADGNEFIDYIGSWGPMILGHANERVINAIKDAAENSTSFGSELRKRDRAGEAGQEICAVVSSLCELSIPEPKRR